MSAKINKTKAEGLMDFRVYHAGSGIKGHRFLGAILPGKPLYYGFEAWGEPYEHWVIDDYSADYNSGNPFKKKGIQFLFTHWYLTIGYFEALIVMPLVGYCMKRFNLWRLT